MVEVVAKVINVTLDEESGGYVIEFWVGQELAEKPTLNEAFAVLGSMDSLQREVYSCMVQWEDDEYTMEPDERLVECIVLFDENPDLDALDPALERKWKTGQLAQGLITHLVNSNLCGEWRTGDDDDDDIDHPNEEGCCASGNHGHCCGNANHGATGASDHNGKGEESQSEEDAQNEGDTEAPSPLAD